MRIAMAEDEQAGSAESKKDPSHRADVVQNLFVASGERHHHGEAALEQNRNHGNARARIHLGYAAKKQSISRHGEINAGRGEDVLAEKSKGGDGNAEGDPGAAALAERHAHDLRGWGRGRGKLQRATGAQANKGHRDEENNNARDADEQTAR